MEPLIVCSMPVRSSSARVETVEGCDLMELRLDYLRSGHETVIRRHRGLPAIITIRDPREGGVHPIGDELKARLLDLALGSGFMIDAELEFLLRHQLGPSGVIASRHSLKGHITWKRALSDYRGAEAAGYSIYKVVSANEEDVPVLVKLLLRGGPVKVAAMVMGSKSARAALAAMGSALLYCSVGEPTASGQLSLRECSELIALLRRLGTWGKK